MKKNYTHFVEQYKTPHTGTLKDTCALGVEHLEQTLQTSKELDMKTIAVFHIRNYKWWEVLLKRLDNFYKDYIALYEGTTIIPVEGKNYNIVRVDTYRGRKRLKLICSDVYD